MSEATSQTSTESTEGSGNEETQGQNQNNQQQTQQGQQQNSQTQKTEKQTESTTSQKTEGDVSKIDLKKLSADELKEVLENPELFKLSRIKDALAAEKELKKIREDQSKRDEESLVEQKKFQELADKRGEEVAKLRQQLQDSAITQALSTKLVGQKTVDLDGALKLIDRNKVTINEDGVVSGVEEAIESLKTDKPYLFKNEEEQQQQVKTVGAASNTQNGNSQGGGKMSFKRSEIANMSHEEYQKNRQDILRAQREGRIENDLA